MTLWNGDLRAFTVPLEVFTPSGDGTTPDFSDFSLTDYGQTIKFGPYEASAGFILALNLPEKYAHGMSAAAYGQLLGALHRQRKPKPD